MLTKLQHLLIKLAEEGAEVAQIALKTSQFGPNEIMPGQPLNNFQRCHQELDDLMAMVEILNREHQFGYATSRERLEAKKAKVQRYLEYSIHLGLVDGETEVTTHPMAKLCAVCGNPQFETPSGVTCKNGHGGAEPINTTADCDLF